MYLRMYVCIYVGMCVCTCICMYVLCMYVYVCVCMNVLFIEWFHDFLVLYVAKSLGFNQLVFVTGSQNFLQYYGIQHFLFYRSGLLRIRCNNFSCFCSIFSVIVYKFIVSLYLLFVGGVVSKMIISSFQYLVLPQLCLRSNICS
jgi:hypothetical protein